MKTFLLLFTFALLLSTISCNKATYEPLQTGTLSGTIRNEFNQPISGALITVGSLKTRSGDTGAYTISGIIAVNCSVVVSKDHYVTALQEVNVSGNATTVLDFWLKKGESSLQVSDSVIRLPYDKGSIDFKVISNTAWLVKNEGVWFNCSLNSGSGNATIRVTWQANTGLEARVDSLKIISGSIVKNIILRQSSHTCIVSVTGLIGNDGLEIADSVLVMFNNPIKIKSLRSTWENCNTDIHFQMVDSKKGVKFNYSCAKLGGKYPFTVSVKDEDSLEFTQSFEAAFYESAVEFKGEITHYEITADQKHCWVTTRNPNKLYCFDAQNLTIQYEYNLPFRPYLFTINPYNHHLYISSCEGVDYYYDNRLYVYSQANGEMVKTIITEPGVPFIGGDTPYSMRFLANGLGLLILSTQGSYIWRFINSAEGDSVYLPSVIPDARFVDVQVNHDLTKLLIMQPYGESVISLLDGATKQFSTFRPVTITPGVIIVASKKNDKVFFGQIYDQCITDLGDNSVSKISYLDNRFDPSADFSNREGEDLRLYYCNDYYLRFMDYSNSTTLMWCDALYHLRDFTTSIDGQSAFAFTTYKLYCFNTDSFHRHINHLKKTNADFMKK